MSDDGSYNSLFEAEAEEMRFADALRRGTVERAEDVLRFVFADGGERHVMVRMDREKEDEEEARLGAVVCGLLGSSADEEGERTVRVTELKSAYCAAHLLDYLQEPVVDKEWSPKRYLMGSLDMEQLVQSYEAAQTSTRLYVPGFVRAVERWIVRTVREGALSLDVVRAAFAVCPRVLSICDNYEHIAGRSPPAAEPCRCLGDDAVECGAALVVNTESKHYWVVACVGTCHEKRDDHEVCRRIALMHPDADDEDDTLVVYKVPVMYMADVLPSRSGTWLPRAPPLSVECGDVERMFRYEDISMVVLLSEQRPAPAPPGYAWNGSFIRPGAVDGKLEHSADALSDFVYFKGLNVLMR